MSGWAVATDVAIWTLILGSSAVFAWFLAELVLLTRRRRDDDGGPPPRDPQ